ncbi:hypothetical protein EHS14_03445 [Schaalia georgiae]|nr:hypothetical protein EHS14_03445 [Schaalia georgiae]
MSTNSTGFPYTPGTQDAHAFPYGTDPRPVGAQPPAASAPKKSKGLAIATIIGAALSVVLLVVTIVLVVGARSRNEEASYLDAQASELERQAIDIKAQKVCDAITRDNRSTAASLFRTYPDAHDDIANAMQRLCADKYKTAKAVAGLPVTDTTVFDRSDFDCVLDASGSTVTITATLKVKQNDKFDGIGSVDLWVKAGFAENDLSFAPFTHSEVIETPTTVSVGSSTTVTATVSYNSSYGQYCGFQIDSWWPTGQ